MSACLQGESSCIQLKSGLFAALVSCYSLQLKVVQSLDTSPLVRVQQQSYLLFDADLAVSTKDVRLLDYFNLAASFDVAQRLAAAVQQLCKRDISPLQLLLCLTYAWLLLQPCLHCRGDQATNFGPGVSSTWGKGGCLVSC